MGVWYIADNLAHIPLQLSKKVTWSKNWTVVAHHLLSNFCFGLGIATTRMHFWGCLNCVCEITNPPLSVVFFLKENSYVDGPVWAPIFRFASITVWVLFFIFRILLFPLWLLLFAHDVYFHYAVLDATMFELVFYPLVTLLLLLLSVQWMAGLTRGLRKCLTTGNTSRESQEKRD